MSTSQQELSEYHLEFILCILCARIKGGDIVGGALSLIIKKEKLSMKKSVKVLDLFRSKKGA